MTSVVEEQLEQTPAVTEESQANDAEANGGAEANADSEAKMRMICTAVEEMKAHDIVVLDVRGQTIISDFFVMCSGTSVTHIQSIAEGVQDRLRERARLRAKPEGDAHSYWVIIDYSDVILHIFSEETREFYDLERLWADAKVTRWESNGNVGNENVGGNGDASGASTLPATSSAQGANL